LYRFRTEFQASKAAKSPSTSTAPEKVQYSEPCPPGMTECHLCGRRFNEDRIGKHEEICRKTKQKKRKAFDPVKMRTQGTEAESFVKSAGKRAPAAAKKVFKINCDFVIYNSLFTHIIRVY